MEIVISVLFFAILIAFLAIYLKNTTIIIKMEYPKVEIPELEEIYDKDGDPKGVKDTSDYDDILKEINNLMLDQEDVTNE